MPTSANMSIVYPDDHTDSDTWGLVLNTIFGTTIDAHDHTTGNGVPIPAAALKINADVSWSFAGTKFAITSAKAIAFSEQATSTVASYTDALFVNSADHNLYFRNNSGTNVQITSGSTLNIAIVGGIGGDYATVSALEAYDDATRRFTFQQELSAGLRAWAGIGTADIDLYQKAASISNKVTLKSPSALASSYSVTFPAALPGSTSLVQLSSAGALTASNALAADPSFTAFTRTITVPLSPATRLTNCGYSNISGTSTGLDGAGAWLTSTGSWEWTSVDLNGLGLRVGDRIKSVRIVHKTIAGTHGWNLYKIVASGGGSGTATLVGTASGSSSNDHTDTVSSPAAIASGEQWFMDLSGSTTGDIVTHVELTFDHP